MLRSVDLVDDLKAILMPYLLPILLNFFDMLGAYGIRPYRSSCGFLLCCVIIILSVILY